MTTTSQHASAPARSPLPDSLADANVLVIGGTSGIGLAAAQLLADLGAHVTVASRAPRDLGELGGRIRQARVDVLDEAGLRALLDAPAGLDHVLVTAAEASAGPVSQTAYEQVASTFDSRMKGSYLVARAVAGRLPAGGSLTLTSATSSIRPLPATSAASAVAAGVEGMVRALAVELAPVRVNAIRPGATDTAMLRAWYDDDALAAMGRGMPLGRVARPEEVAAAALFCMANPYVTGSVVTVDGGTSLT